MKGRRVFVVPPFFGELFSLIGIVFSKTRTDSPVITEAAGFPLTQKPPLWIDKPYPKKTEPSPENNLLRDSAIGFVFSKVLRNSIAEKDILSRGSLHHPVGASIMKVEPWPGPGDATEMRPFMVSIIFLPT